MVQYFSQWQCCSVLSHIAQTMGAGMGASRENCTPAVGVRQGKRQDGVVDYPLVFPATKMLHFCRPQRASLTLRNVRASIDFYPSYRNGISQLAHSLSNSQNPAQRAAPPF